MIGDICKQVFTYVCLSTWFLVFRPTESYYTANLELKLLTNVDL